MEARRSPIQHPILLLSFCYFKVGTSISSFIFQLSTNKSCSPICTVSSLYAQMSKKKKKKVGQQVEVESCSLSTLKLYCYNIMKN